MVEAKAADEAIVSNLAVLTQPTLDLLRDLGVYDSVLPGASLLRPSVHTASIGSVTHGLRNAADGKFLIRYSSPISSVSQDAHGVSVHMQGSEDVVRAALYIDATGGSSPALREAGIIQQPVGKPIYIRLAQIGPIQENGRPTEMIGKIPGFSASTKRTGDAYVFGFQNPHDGTTLATDRVSKKQADATDMREIIESGRPDQFREMSANIQWQRTVTIQQAVVDHAHNGRIIAVGDSVALKSPAGAPGMNQAVRDATLVKDAWIEIQKNHSLERVLGDLDSELVRQHARQIR